MVDNNFSGLSEPLIDASGRVINTLRISVNPSCNFNCLYCWSAEGNQESKSALPKANRLRRFEIIALTKAFAKLGISSLKITGGEPLIRRNILPLIDSLIHLAGIEDVLITTNGARLLELAPSLYEVGLRRINVSLDSLKEDRFQQITGHRIFSQVFAGIEKVLELGFSPIKINTVLMKGINDDEVNSFVNLIFQYPLHLRFIEYMPIGSASNWRQEAFLSNVEVFSRIEEQFGKLSPIDKTLGTGPARYYSLQGALGYIGFINPISDRFCHSCNRIRLTPDGFLRLCLGRTDEIDLRNPLRNGASEDEIVHIIREAVSKFQRGHLFHLSKEESTSTRMMMHIGG